MSSKELAALLCGRCEARAFSRFTRVPYVTEPSPQGARVVGDLRYDRQPGLDFSDFLLGEREAECPKYVPPWLPPRSDVLSESR